MRSPSRSAPPSAKLSGSDPASTTPPSSPSSPAASAAAASCGPRTSASASASSDSLPCGPAPSPGRPDWRLKPDGSLAQHTILDSVIEVKRRGVDVLTAGSKGSDTESAIVTGTQPMKSAWGVGNTDCARKVPYLGSERTTWYP
ncbi:hypothetical protein TSOC_002609, partial [Tetrabaena socialis]